MAQNGRARLRARAEEAGRLEAGLADVEAQRRQWARATTLLGVLLLASSLAVMHLPFPARALESRREENPGRSDVPMVPLPLCGSYDLQSLVLPQIDEGAPQDL